MKSVQKLPLYIHIVEARTLLPSDANGWSDPLCRVLIGSEKFKKIYKTKYINRTLNPRWNETYIYQYNANEDAYQSSLKFEIYDHDSLTANDLLGYCEIPLSTYSDHKWVEKWYKLRNFDKDGRPLRCRGYLRVKIQITSHGQTSFLEEDKSPETNIHETRDNIFQKQEERARLITQSQQSNLKQAQTQHNINRQFHRKITEQAKLHQNGEGNPLEVDVSAPLNPQFDNLPENTFDPNQPIIGYYPGQDPAMAYQWPKFLRRRSSSKTFESPSTPVANDEDVEEFSETNSFSV